MATRSQALPLSSAQVAAIAAGTAPSNHAYSVVLAGDSITSQCFATITPTSITSSGTTATVTYAGHSLAVGQQCTIQGCTETGYNGCWRVASATATTFTVTTTATPSASPATGSPQICLGNAYQNNGYFSYLTGANLSLLNNAGLGGDTTAGLYSRLQTDVHTYAADCVIVNIGINNLRTGGATAAATWTGAAGSEGIKEVVDAILATGRRVILCTIIPLDVGDSFFSTAVGGITCPKRILAVNRSIRAYCNTTPNLYLADVAAPLASTNADGRALAANIGSAPHPSPAGAQLMAIPIMDALELCGARPISLVSSELDTVNSDAGSKNVTYNPFFTGTGGSKDTGVTGTMADSWRTERLNGSPTVVCTTEARTIAADGDALGNNQVLTISSTAASDQIQFRSFITYGTQFTNADIINLLSHVQISSAVNLQYFYGFVEVVVDAVNYFAYWDYNGTGTAIPSLNQVIQTRPLTVPAGTISNYYIGFVAQFSGAGGAVVKFGRTESRKV